MKKVLSFLLIFLVVLLFTACEQEPREECLTEWDYKIEERTKYFVSYSAYIIKTDYGDVDVTKKIYESAQEGKYSSICVLVVPKGPVTFISGTLLDGTPIEQSLIDEIAEQVIPSGTLPDELDEEETEE